MRGRGSPLGIDLMGKGKRAPGGGTITMKIGSGWWGVCVCEEGGLVGRLTGAERGAPARPDPPRHSAAANDVADGKASSYQLA